MTARDGGGGVVIRAIRPATVEEWSDAFDACPFPWLTFFHGPAWSRIWATYSDGRLEPRPRRVEFADERVAVLGITAERLRTGVVRWHASPAGTYGGWVSATPLLDGHVALLTDALTRHPSLIWRRSPSEDLAGPVPGTAAESSHLIDLRDGADAARARWKPTARNKVRRAERSGARVREAESLEDWRAYGAVYRRTTGYWDRPTSSYDASLFPMMREVAGDGVRLWLVERDGEVLAGTVACVAGRRAVLWSTGTIREAPPGLTNLLSWHVVGALADEGFEWCDLNPSGGHAGVEAYKAGLGARALPAPILVQRHWSEGAVARVRALRGRVASHTGPR